MYMNAETAGSVIGIGSRPRSERERKETLEGRTEGRRFLKWW